MSLQVYAYGLAAKLYQYRRLWCKIYLENILRTVGGTGKDTLDQTGQTGYLLLHGLHSLPKTRKYFTQFVYMNN